MAQGRPFDRAIEWVLYPCVCWLFLVGLWSGPGLGATLVYPNGLLAVEAALAIVLLLLMWRGRVVPLQQYPFLLPCLGVMALAALAALARVFARGEPFEALRLWQHGEPMLRGLLIYLALVGRPRLLRAAIGAAVVGFGLLAISCMVQHFTGVTRWYVALDRGWESGIQAMRDTPRGQGLTSYINLTAAMLATALPFWSVPSAMGAVARHPWARILLPAGGVATAAALLYTNARGPVLAVALVACVVVWHLRPRQRWSMMVATALFFAVTMLPGQMVAPASLAALAIGGLCGIYAWRGRHTRLILPALALMLVGGVQSIDAYVLHLPLGLRVIEQGVKDGARLALYEETLVQVTHAPLWGVGGHDLAMALTQGPTAVRLGLDLLPRTQWNAHNQVLQWAGAEGVPVALAFTMLVLGGVWWLWRQVHQSHTRFQQILTLSTAIALTLFLVTNLAEAHFWRIEGGGLYWSLLALASACVATGQHDACEAVT
jgi:hypothetical protein